MKRSIDARAALCAARHFAAAHESACTGEAVDFGSICTGCAQLPDCKGNWTEAAAPIFDAAGGWPQLLRPFSE